MVHERVAEPFLAILVSHSKTRLPIWLNLLAVKKCRRCLTWLAQDGDFDTEWLTIPLGLNRWAALLRRLNICVGIDHSDAIMTNSIENAGLFINRLSTAIMSMPRRALPMGHVCMLKLPQHKSFMPEAHGS